MVRRGLQASVALRGASQARTCAAWRPDCRAARAGQLVQALGGAPDGQATLVALFSVASAAGRLAAGHLPERALASRRTPRCAPAHCKPSFRFPFFLGLKLAERI
jgi:hypothetical protein